MPGKGKQKASLKHNARVLVIGGGIALVLLWLEFVTLAALLSRDVKSVTTAITWSLPWCNLSQHKPAWLL